MNIFTYTIYIRTSAEKLFAALTQPEFTRQYWANTVQECVWEPGASWKILTPDGRAADTGEVLEYDPPRTLAVSWHNHLSPEMEAEGPSTARFELEAQSDGSIKLTVTHLHPLPDSQLIAAVSQGWPGILSSLKSLLETGESLPHTREWPEGV